jgi:hypothetical protein
VAPVSAINSGHGCVLLHESVQRRACPRIRLSTAAVVFSWRCIPIRRVPPERSRGGKFFGGRLSS